MSANLSLGDALASTETIAQTAPDPAQVEQTVSASEDQSATTDSSLNTVEQPKQDEPPVETRAELDFRALREQKTTLETELQTVRSRFDEFGGETQLQIMQPVLQKALELPRTDAEREKWAGDMFGALSQALMPDQLMALRQGAAWNYLLDPQSLPVITEQFFGEGMTPAILQQFAALFQQDPYLLDKLRPEETWEQQQAREAQEKKDRERDERDKARDAQLQKIEDESAQMQTRQVMNSVFQVALNPRTEVKKQYGLEYQKGENDTPEIAAFKERASSRYDRMVMQAMMADAELNRLANSAEYLAGQKDANQRARAESQFAPEMQRRVTTLCAQVAKDLAEDLKLFSPDISDRTKAENLKDLPAQVLGGTAVTSSSGVDLSGMPDPASNPRGYEQWVARITQEQSRAARTPGILAG